MRQNIIASAILTILFPVISSSSTLSPHSAGSVEALIDPLLAWMYLSHGLPSRLYKRGNVASRHVTLMETPLPIVICFLTVKYANSYLRLDISALEEVDTNSHQFGVPTLRENTLCHTTCFFKGRWER